MNCQNKMLEQIKSEFHQKYDYLSPQEVDTLCNTSVKDFVYRRYPSANNRPPIEKLSLDFYEKQWVLDRMEDILSRAGGTNVIGYRENGVNITYASSYIDPHLASQIMPKGSVPK